MLKNKSTFVMLKLNSVTQDGGSGDAPRDDVQLDQL